MHIIGSADRKAEQRERERETSKIPPVTADEDVRGGRKVNKRANGRYFSNKMNWRVGDQEKPCIREMIHGGLANGIKEIEPNQRAKESKPEWEPEREPDC